MTAPDPGLTDLIAAHWRSLDLLKMKYICSCGDWEYRDDDRERACASWCEHLALVVEQHTNGRIAELREWQIKVATALGMCEEVMGIGYSIASAKDASERAESLTTLELEHFECPVWCDECERMERWQSCTHCNGSGCGPGTASGAYEECQWCAGDGRDHEPDLTTRADKAEATIARVEKALAEGPLHRIDFPRSKDPYGIERQTIRAALEGEQQ